MFHIVYGPLWGLVEGLEGYEDLCRLAQSCVGCYEGQ